MFELSAFNAFILALGSILAGIILLVRGGDWTINSSVYIARHSGISPMVVGFTIVAFGTSLPELVVSILANLEGSPGIAIGNVLGSNIANILFVIGVTAVFFTLATRVKAVLKDLTMMMLATLLIMAFMLSGTIGLVHGIFMVALLVIYVFFQYLMTVKGIRPSVESEAEEEPEFANAWSPYLFLGIGIISIALGAELLVRGAKVSAEVIGVPDAVIALSVIAFGTSLPELSTCLIAARKGHSDIAIGNIVGSNVFNLLMILGVTSAIKPILPGSYAAQLVDFDIWVVLAVSLLFSFLLLLYRKITRPAGFMFITAYLLYNIYIYAIYITP